MSDVSLLVAFGAGVLALIAPCGALLLPAFFAYAFTGPRALLARTAVFFLGLASVLVPLGAGARWAISLVYEHRSTVITVAGWTIIGLGVLQIMGGGFRVPFAARLEARAADRGTGLLSTYLLGSVYGLAGFCTGPVLGAILTMAATSASPWWGGVLLATYALGMAAPLFVMALLWSRFDLGRRGFLRGRAVRLGPITTHTTSIIAGVLFVVIGVLFLRTDGLVGLTGWLGDTTETEFRAQRWLTDHLGGVPDWLIVALVLALVGALVAWRVARRRRPPGRAISARPSSG